MTIVGIACSSAVFLSKLHTPTRAQFRSEFGVAVFEVEDVLSATSEFLELPWPKSPVLSHVIPNFRVQGLGFLNPPQTLSGDTVGGFCGGLARV